MKGRDCLTYGSHSSHKAVTAIESGTVEGGQGGDIDRGVVLADEDVDRLGRVAPLDRKLQEVTAGYESL